MVNLNRIYHHTTSPYNPQANGSVERLIGTVGKMLLKQLYRAMNEWDDAVSYLQYAYNCKVRALTGSTPVSMMFGRSPNKFLKLWKTRTQANSNMNLVLLRKHQDELTKTVYPAISERVLRSKKNDAQAFARNKAVIIKDVFPSGPLVMMRDVQRSRNGKPAMKGLSLLSERITVVSMFCATSLVFSSVPCRLIT